MKAATEALWQQKDWEKGAFGDTVPRIVSAFAAAQALKVPDAVQRRAAIAQVIKALFQRPICFSGMIQSPILRRLRIHDLSRC